MGPVVEELELTKYGLEYLFCDPVVFCPHPDGKYFLGHRSVEKTCAEIQRYSPRDAEKYAEFADFWQRLLRAIIPMFNAPQPITQTLKDAGNSLKSTVESVFKI